MPVATLGYGGGGPAAFGYGGAGTVSTPPGADAPGTVAVGVLPLGAEAPIPGDMLRFGNPSQASGAAPFADLAGTPTDPTAVTLVVQKPDGTKLHYGWPVAGTDGALTRESAGRFYFDVFIDQSSAWRFREAGTGAVTAASEGAVRVQRQRVTP